MPILEVENLRTHYFTDAGPVKAADGVSFTLEKGESIGIAGESGKFALKIGRHYHSYYPDNKYYH